jgi:hypothetical protein
LIADSAVLKNCQLILREFFHSRPGETSVATIQENQYDGEYYNPNPALSTSNARPGPQP